MKVQHAFLKYLQGSWKVKKSLSDVGSGTGFADFKPRSDGSLFYREDVKIISAYASWKGRAEHSYKIMDNKLYLKLMESADYNQIHLEDYGITHTYICGRDIYETLYFINGPVSFRSVCIASGPEKNYTVTTDYDRMTDDERLMHIACLAGHHIGIDQES